MNTTVIYYEQGTPREELQATANMVADVLEGTKVLVLPKNFDLLLNCSADQLLHIRSIIDTALAYKLQEAQQQMQDLPSVEKVVEKEIEQENKVIDITHYLHKGNNE